MASFWSRLVRTDADREDAANMLHTVLLAIVLIVLLLFLASSYLCQHPAVSGPSDTPGVVPGR
ncbi:MAG: hypothetical protein A3F84_08265 [Candidatus Handelsmanbacteria bacterium RIFCSPLOWO2_12_FULL_64_10]|uniref:Uncharacterized protein n=1 Tax=Handelsmanbacteria sp. (strain RIFCSPLOWO2_12_FULL_64_10) TaxID=1817868 RepID=A0A1F6D2C8_HANXR|nr:MAG: hypothetical protein A3F84_08265 [Candidatus Handelsmanbacteria bacterium RIFCSPLOWO2_12_FULL_64_10]